MGHKQKLAGESTESSGEYGSLCPVHTHTHTHTHTHGCTHERTGSVCVVHAVGTVCLRLFKWVGCILSLVLFFGAAGE